MGWSARAAQFERLKIHCETSRYMRSDGRWLTKITSTSLWSRHFETLLTEDSVSWDFNFFPVLSACVE